jgi:murein DD-endopeptidase MepM/ murein hydrolase activator NlpD
MPPPPENATDPLGTTTGDTGVVGTDIQGLLASLYGQNPFAISHTGMGGEERAYTQGPLSFLIQAGLSQTLAEMFVQNVVDAVLASGVSLEQIGAVGLSQLVSSMWSTPYIREQFVIKQSPSGVTAAIKNEIAGTTAAGLTTISAASDAATAVPKPFDPKYAANITLKYGQQGMGTTEVGNDVGMPEGTQLYAPFAGTISTEDHGKSDWGKRVFLHLDNGYVIAFGHLHQFNVVDGQRINPGDLMGLSGGDPGDPSSGNSSGAHIEVQVIAPNGQFQDPAAFIQRLFAGTTFGAESKFFGQGILGGGVSAAAAKARLTAQDPVTLSREATIRSLWQRYFGIDPTERQILSVVPHGQDATQWEDFIRTLPSHLPGIAIGPYLDIRSLADSKFQSVYGHPSNDRVVQELFNAGLTNPDGVGYYIDQMPFQPGKQVSPIVYNAVYGSAAAYTQQIWNQPPDPRDLFDIWQQAGAPGQLQAADAMEAANTAKARLSLVPPPDQGGDTHMPPGKQ